MNSIKIGNNPNILSHIFLKFSPCKKKKKKRVYSSEHW